MDVTLSLTTLEASRNPITRSATSIQHVMTAANGSTTKTRKAIRHRLTYVRQRGGPEKTRLPNLQEDAAVMIITEQQTVETCEASNVVACAMRTTLAWLLT